MKKKTLLGFWQKNFAFLLIVFMQSNMLAQLNLTSATYTTGNTLTVDIGAENFQDLLSAQFTLVWDDEVLTYSTVNNFGLPSLTATDFGNNPNHLLNGQLPFSWFDTEVMGVSVDDGTVIFSVEFDIISNDDPSFAIEDCPTPIEVTNINFLDVDLLFNGAPTGGCDGSGNGGSDFVSDWVIEFPADITLDWPATTAEAGNPEVFFDDDELIGISFQDVITYNVPGFDARIERTWTAINWVEVSNPPNNYIVEVPENQLAAPNDDLNGDGSSNDRTFRDSWDGNNFPSELGDDWDGYIRYTQTIWINDGTSDPCDTDDTAPTPYCLSGLTVILENTTSPPSVEVWAIDFDAGSYDNCSNELVFSFSNNPVNQSIVFTDSDIGTQTVEVWVTDDAGNQDFCSTLLNIVDGVPPGNESISGFIADPFGNPMADVIVNCSFGNIIYSATTNSDGFYEVTNLPAGETYTVTAEKPSNDYNSGVTTFDVAKLRCIILGLEQPQPYQILASDINQSFGATTFDMVLLNRLILGIEESFAVPVWQFVSDFGNPSPWDILNVSQEIVIENLSGNVINQNFMAVKAGNLVEETNPNPLFQPSFDLEEVSSSNPNQVLIDLAVEDFENFTSAQFALTWDSDVLEYDSYELVADPPAGNTIWSDVNLVDGNLRVIVQDPAMVGTLDLADGETLMQLTFNILEVGDTEVSFVDDAIFPKIVTVNGCDLAGGVFNFSNAPINLLNTSTEDNLEQLLGARLLPNVLQVGEETLLEILNSKANEYHLNLLNATGEMIWTRKMNYQSQQAIITAPDSPGMYYLQIQGNDGNSKVLKLIVL